MDPVDPKRRGRRLFGGRRRHEHAAEDQMNEPVTVPDAPPSGADPDPEATVADDLTASDTASSPTAVGTLGEEDRATEPDGDEPEVLDGDEEIAVLTDTASDLAAEPVAAPIADAVGTDVSDETPETERATRSVVPEEGDVREVGAATQGDDEEGVEPYDLPRILAVANQKGGVGKTTTSVNLGAALAEMGYRVLVVDLDPQGNATTGLGVNARELEGSVYDVIMNDTAVEDCVEPTSLKNLFVAPATIDLAGAEIELVPAFSRELKLRRALHDIRDDYDYVLIDCPPSLGLLTVNGLAAADDVVVPIQCEYYALEGLSQLIRNVSLVQKNLNPSLNVRGIVLTMYDARTKLSDQVEQEVRTHFGRTVYQTVVPRTVRLSEAPSFGQPIILFDPTSRGAVAYRELAKEVSSGATRRAG
jgi:chromosome partitioning protein